MALLVVKYLQLTINLVGVDLESPFAGRSRRLDGPLTHQRTLMGMGTSHISSEKPHDRGLDLEKTSRLRRGRTFFLTSLLIELIEPRKGERKAHVYDIAWYQDLI